MEPNRLPDPEAPKRRQANPARKWLIVSACGFVISFAAFGYHIAAGGSSSSNPLPVTVLRQVFGFTPYYFENNMPPDRLKLQPNTPKFFGNALTFDIANSKNQKITISQKALPPDYKRGTNSTDTSFEAPVGSSLIQPVKGGHITAIVKTKDNTLIILDSSDILNSDTLKSVINKLTAVDKQTGNPTTPAQ